MAELVQTTEGIIRQMIEWLAAIPAIHVMYSILCLIVVATIFIIFLLNKDHNSKISFTDLITQDGRLSERKLIRFCTWIISSWGFIYLIVTEHLTEWYYLGYMGAWVANALLDKALQKQNNNYQNNQYNDPYINNQYPVAGVYDPYLDQRNHNVNG